MSTQAYHSSQPPAPIRILFVFAWLVVGGEETEVRLLAEHLDRSRFHIDVVACSRREGMPDQTHEQLAQLGVSVDRAPYALSFEQTVTYLADQLPAYDVVVACQNVPDVYPALERLEPQTRPALIEHGGLVAEALAGPKHLTERYVGVCASIRDAAASRMPGPESHSLRIPSMVDLTVFRPGDRQAARRELGIGEGETLVGWVGRLDAKKRVEDFVEAAAIVRDKHPEARFVVVGGADAFMPEYAEKLTHRAQDLGLDDVLHFLGDRPDVPRLLAGLDIFVWLSRDEGMPHVIAEAGAAGLSVVATADNGSMEQIEHGVSGLFVPHEDPASVAAAVTGLVEDAALRADLGLALRMKVAAEYSVPAVLPLWERLFADVATRPSPVGPDDRPPWRSFFMGGFECSTHRRRDGVRLDVLRSTRHDIHAEKDYRLAAAHGLRTVRDGLRWHLIEEQPGRYDWSSWLPMLRAATASGTQVIWDIWHAGTPDHVDIWSADFVERLVDFATAAAALHREVSDEPALWVPMNEVSFYSFIAGQVGDWHPYAVGSGYELKCQLARAAIATAEALRSVDPACRLLWSEPLIHVAPTGNTPGRRANAEGHRLAQYQAFDMICGRLEPQLGGRPGLLDIVGCNFYPHNQWVVGGKSIPLGHHDFRPLADMLTELHERYGRPMLICETGAEGSARAPWLHYVCQEVTEALADGVPVTGICLYPVTGYAGWDDDRRCETGLFGYPAEDGSRPTYASLDAELLRQRAFFDSHVSQRWTPVVTPRSGIQDQGYAGLSTARA